MEVALRAFSVVTARAKKFATTTEVMIANWVQRFKKRGPFPKKVVSDSEP